MITLNIAGTTDLQDKLTRLSKDGFGVDRVLQVIAQRVFDNVIAGAEKHSKTGNMVRSFGTGAKRIPNGYRIEADLQFAPETLFVNFGTRPHKIYPKDKKALRWVSGNGFMFAKFINHPGYKGDPFMQSAVDTVMRDFDQIVKANFLKDK